MRPLYLSPSEAVVLRHALMSYRNTLSARWREQPSEIASSGFELVASDGLLQRLDIMSERLLVDDYRSAFAPAPCPHPRDRWVKDSTGVSCSLCEQWIEEDDTAETDERIDADLSTGYIGDFS